MGQIATLGDILSCPATVNEKRQERFSFLKFPLCYNMAICSTNETIWKNTVAPLAFRGLGNTEFKDLILKNIDFNCKNGVFFYDRCGVKILTAIGNLHWKQQDANKVISPNYVYYTIYSYAVSMTPQGRTPSQVDRLHESTRWFLTKWLDKCHVVSV